MARVEKVMVPATYVIRVEFTRDEAHELLYVLTGAQRQRLGLEEIEKQVRVILYPGSQ